MFVVIAALTGCPTNKTITEKTTGTATAIKSTFEDGKAAPWAKKNAEQLAVSTEYAHNGKFSLKVSGRTQFWEGPEINLTGKLIRGEKYTVTVWIYQTSNAPHDIKVTVYNLDDTSTNPYEGKFYTTVCSDPAVPQNTWTKLEGSFIFKYAGNYLKSTLYIESPDTEYDFYVDDITISGAFASEVTSIETDLPSLAAAYKNYFPIGVAFPSSVFDSKLMTDLIKKHFNSVTAEWEMKPGPIWKAEDKFDFTAADKYVQFTSANNMRLRGHTLVWHIENPGWLFKDPANPSQPASKDLLLKRLQTYIYTVVGRYKGKVDSWDVVNEAIDTAEPDNLRNNEWKKIIGPEYIEKAFLFAREADPNAKLFYNDYETENPVKRQAIYDLVKNLKAKGIYVDGIGSQGHVSLSQPPAAKIEETIAKFAELGVKFEITELDVSVFNSASPSSISKDDLIRQGYRYKEIADMLKKHKDVVSGLTFWGLKDDMSWLAMGKLDAPLLFDKNCRAKPAFWGLVDGSKLPVLIKSYEAGRGTPVIDAEPELLWDVLPNEIIMSKSNAALGSFKVSYDDKRLNLLISVFDKAANPDDSVEVFIDWKNKKENKISSDVKSFKLARSTINKADGLAGAVKNNKDGYVIEVALPLDPGLLNTDKIIGLDLRVNTGNEIVCWNDPTDSVSEKTENYGKVKLGKGPEYSEAIAGTPTIDGEMDPSWQKANSFNTKVVLGTGKVASAKVRTMWDENNVYLYAEVTDPVLSAISVNPWEQDSLEVFIDQNYARTPVYQDDDAQYRANYKNVKTFTGAGVIDKFRTATKIVPGGYVVEAAVPLTKVKGKKGKLIGFDIQINDDNGKGWTTAERQRYY
jgi:endo-1,4-beta-xylanase